MRGLNNDPNNIQMSAPVQPGNSGGALLDSSGNVIGVVASKLDVLNALARSGDLPQNVNFAISLPVLKAFLARSGVRATEAASRVELRPDEVGDRAKSFTYAIECEPQVMAGASEQRRVDIAAPAAPFARGRTSAQKAVLSEEDQANPNGTEFVGSVVWRAEQLASGTGQKPDVVLRSEIEIPGQKVSVRLSMRRNDDKELPVSHTVEIVFTLPPGFPHGGISEITGVLMKQGETTAGVPLDGIVVKLTTNFFLMGLSPDKTERNIQLLKERSWLDIPIVYGDGKRAIIAIEKGTPGERAFAEAFKAWGDSARGKATALPKGAVQPLR
jgi:hypothetical protein